LLDEYEVNIIFNVSDLMPFIGGNDDEANLYI